MAALTLKAQRGELSISRAGPRKMPLNGRESRAVCFELITPLGSRDPRMTYRRRMISATLIGQFVCVALVRSGNKTRAAPFVGGESTLVSPVEPTIQTQIRYSFSAWTDDANDQSLFS